MSAAGVDNYSVACPRCAAPASVRCFNSKFPHDERHEAAKLAAQAKTDNLISGPLL